MDLNKVYNVDVLEGLGKLEDKSVDLIITSPPYNKAGINGLYKRYNRNWTVTIDYGGDANIDSMPEEEYEQWQIKILNECFRVLKDDGSMFYNHKNRIATGEGEIISPYKWLYQTPFKIRQEIIWDRKCTPNVYNVRYMPTTELIFWLAKSNKPRFKRDNEAEFKTEVWTLPVRKNTEHPAPFPIELPDNIIPSVAQGERITVLDPFMGSGTVAVSAIKNGCDYIGFELFPEYIDMTNKRIKLISAS